MGQSAANTVDDPAGNLLRWQRHGKLAVRPGVLGSYVDQRKQRSELVRRRITGRVQKSQQPLSEPKRIVTWHEPTLIVVASPGH
jgi:hypothetical protein